jgi:hypothetical protein
MRELFAKRHRLMSDRGEPRVSDAELARLLIQAALGSDMSQVAVTEALRRVATIARRLTSHALTILQRDAEQIIDGALDDE